MSRPRFLADHDLNEHIIDGVTRREPGLEWVRVRDLSLNGAPDGQVLSEAATRGLIVVSHDVNTMAAAARARLERREVFPGLILVRQSLPVGRVIEDITLIWAASELE